MRCVHSIAVLSIALLLCLPLLVPLAASQDRAVQPNPQTRQPVNPPTGAERPNHVLSLDGNGDYVSLPSDIFSDLTEATVEGWVRWESFGNWSRFFDFGSEWQSMKVAHRSTTPSLVFDVTVSQFDAHRIEVADVLQQNQWYHIAAVSGRDGMKLYLNGVPVGENDYDGSFVAIGNGDSNYLGRSNWRASDNADFHGQMDEVRVWSIARTQEQIQGTMFAELQGDEPGFIGYWAFEGDDEIARDATPNSHHAQMLGDAHRVAMPLPQIPEETLSHRVRLDVDRQLDLSTGEYSLAIHAGRHSWVAGMEPRPVLVEITDESSKRLFGEISQEHEPVVWPVPPNVYGQVHIRVSVSLADGREHIEEVECILQTPAGAGKPSGGSLDGKIGLWKHYGHIDGLASNIVYVMSQASDGALWFGSWLSGVSRYDGQEWTTFTEEDGLGHNINNTIWSLLGTRDGMLWAGHRNGLVNWDGQVWQPVPHEALAGQRVNALLETQNGDVWVSADTELLRYDGTTWQRFGEADGWSGGVGMWGAIHEGRDGSVWACLGGQLKRFDGQRWQVICETPGVGRGRAYAETADGTLWVAERTGGLVRYDGQKAELLTEEDGVPTFANIWALLQTQDGMLWVASSSLARYDGESWFEFPQEHGLPITVSCLLEMPDQTLMVGTWYSGVYLYYRDQWLNITEEDGLPGDDVNCLLEAQDGSIWVGTNKGLGRYDGKTWHTVDEADGLPTNNVGCLLQASDGALWVAAGAWGKGMVSRYDGSSWLAFAEDDGLPRHVNSLTQAADNRIWLTAGFDWHGGELCVYDGRGWETVEIPGSTGQVSVLHAQDGTRWVGTYFSGLFHTDGSTWTQYTADDGLVSQNVTALMQSRDGAIWVGVDNGLSCYDGTQWQSFTGRDGSVGVSVQALLQTGDGKVWVGTRDGGVNLFDGRCFQSINTEDGLLSNDVSSLLQAEDGSVWVGTEAGISRLRPSTSPPGALVRQVVADDETYTKPKGFLELVGPIERLSIDYRGISFGMRKGSMKYLTRLSGMDADWRAPTTSERTEYTRVPFGEYTFQMQAVDRWLNYSETVELKLQVVRPLYLRAVFLVPTVGSGCIVLVIAIVASVMAIRRRHQIHAYELLAVQELQDARSMQMALMPQQAPTIEGAEIAGKCVTANTVGGDFFSYLPGGSSHAVGLVVADVSGKAMRGAMNAVLADGVLSMAVEEAARVEPAHLMTRINNALTFRMDSDMNVTMVIGLLDTWSMTLTVANAAHHARPLLVRDGEVTPMKARGLPLGMRAGIEYREESFGLQPGDVLVLMTDGIIEAHDSHGAMYGDSGQLEQVLLGFTPEMSAEAMVDAIISDAIDYGAGDREDDMTTVVAKLRSS